MKTMFKKASTFLSSKACYLSKIMNDDRGDLAVETLGKIIIAVVLVGVVVAAVNAAFPSILSGILNQVQNKLTANW